MIDIIIREFDERDAETVSRLIRNNLTFVNSRDYEPAVIDYMCRLFTPDYLCGISATRTMFVAEENGKVVGTVGLEGDEVCACDCGPGCDMPAGWGRFVTTHRGFCLESSCPFVAFVGQPHGSRFL